MFYEKTVLPSGLTVVTERLTGFRSVSLGFWVATGSRDESPETSGISHFLEHMLFKGTPSRTAEQISIDFDRIGADSNAFTSKECTCFFTRFLDERLDEAFGILADMLVNSQFAPSCIDSEREVVIEEIARAEDTPEGSVFDVAAKTLWPSTPLGRPILGTRQIVGAFCHDDCDAYHKARYTAGNVVVAAAGNLEHAHVVQLSEALLAQLPAISCTSRFAEPPAQGQIRAVFKETEQAHVVYTLPGLPANDPQRFAASILDTVVGSGTGSRLFQEVREKRGLAYAISSYGSSYQGVGVYGVYAGTRPANLEEVVAITGRVLGEVLRNGITRDELERAKELVASSVILCSESTRARMTSLGRNEVIGCEQLSLIEQERRLREVTLNDCRAVAERILVGKPTVAVISPLEPDDAMAAVANAIG